MVGSVGNAALDAEAGGGVPGGRAEGPVGAGQRLAADAVEVEPGRARRGQNDCVEAGPERRQLSRRRRPIR